MNTEERSFATYVVDKSAVSHLHTQLCTYAEESCNEIISFKDAMLMKLVRKRRSPSSFDTRRLFKL